MWSALAWISVGVALCKGADWAWLYFGHDPNDDGVRKAARAEAKRRRTKG